MFPEFGLTDERQSAEDRKIDSIMTLDVPFNTYITKKYSTEPGEVNFREQTRNFKTSGIVDQFPGGRFLNMKGYQ